MKHISYLCMATVLALSADNTARAQSSLTLSGYLDLGLTHTTGRGLYMGTLGRSNVALTGVEDLGNGLSALFKISTRFEMHTGTLEYAPAGTRPFLHDESTVGLRSGFGTVRLGRARTPLNALNDRFDPWYNFDRVGSPLFTFGAPDYLPDPGNVYAPTGSDLEYTRLSNGIFYDSPVFGGGFQVHLFASPQKERGIDIARGMGGAISYKNGPLSLAADYEQNSQKDKLIFLGASYTVGDFRFTGTYSHVKLNPEGSVWKDWMDWDSASYPTTKRTSMTLGAAYQIGQGTIRVGFGRDFQGSINHFNYIGSTFDNAGTGYSGPSNFYSLGYAYALSKRTTLVVDVARINWKYTDDNGRKGVTSYAIGMSHAF